MEEVRCIYCGKMNYTSSPRFVNKCSYCGRPFVKLQGKGPGRDKRQDNDKRKLRVK